MVPAIEPAASSPDDPATGVGNEGLRCVRFLPRYATERNNMLKEFYLPALRASTTYDRATGFFRSSFFAMTKAAMADFALADGTARLICSPDLSAEDLDALRRGASAREVGKEALRRELAHMLESPEAATGAEILSALIGTGALQIRLGVLTEGQGIFHDKFGVFADQYGNRVSFSGSVNETWNAWHPLGNHESFEVFTSWSPDWRRTTDHACMFEHLWRDKNDGVTTIDASGIVLDALQAYSAESPVEILRRHVTQTSRPKAKALYPFQAAALASWANNGQRGVLKHATGSGKTITAIAAIRQHLAAGQPVLILVPSTLLLEQWEIELRRELAALDPTILLAGGGRTGWPSLLRAFTRAEGSQPRITIAVLDTASTSRFLRRVEAGSHLLIVADEVHRLGAPAASAILDLDAGPRLGLSATPERAGDPDGTQRIFGYFGPILEPEFSLGDAISAGRLCPYEYHVSLIRLTSAEEERWLELSTRIGRSYAQSDAGHRDFGRLDDALRLLIIQRARIARGAAQKVPAAAKIVAHDRRNGQHWLVYCEDRDQLGAMRERLTELGVESMPYYSAMEGDREATLAQFARRGGVLVAIRCLDEGVDIPAISHAVILASSRNPREFIQRRGRVLRKHPGKRFAVIHDLLVTPPDGAAADFGGLAIGELSRAWEFARHARNPDAQLQLDALAIRWGISLERAAEAGYEAE